MPAAHLRAGDEQTGSNRFAAGDAVIGDVLRRNQATVESMFREALQRAQSSGELSRKQDPAALARFFVVTIQGMRALARLKSDRRLAVLD